MPARKLRRSRIMGTLYVPAPPWSALFRLVVGLLVRPGYKHPPEDLADLSHHPRLGNHVVESVLAEVRKDGGIRIAAGDDQFDRRIQRLQSRGSFDSAHTALHRQVQH